MSKKFFCLTDEYGHPITVLEAASIERARSRVKRVSKEEILSIDSIRVGR